MTFSKTSELWWCTNTVLTNVFLVITFLQCIYSPTLCRMFAGAQCVWQTVLSIQLVNEHTRQHTLHDWIAHEALSSYVHHHFSLHGVNYSSVKQRENLGNISCIRRITAVMLTLFYPQKCCEVQCVWTKPCEHKGHEGRSMELAKKQNRGRGKKNKNKKKTAEFK